MKRFLSMLIFVFVLYGCQSEDSGSSSSDPVDATADATTDTPTDPVVDVTIDTPVINSQVTSTLGKIELGKTELGK
jgi:hypothetical protein